jgi:GTP pyrophosphokinase
MEHNTEQIISLIFDISEENKSLISRAVTFASTCHAGQCRHSGEPYITHTIAVSCILARMHADIPTIIAGILHDTLEDTQATDQEITEQFGTEVLTLVQGVTKLGKLKYKGVERHAESLRKFFIASANDIRVVAIKLADRLHNISTLEYVPKEKQHRIAIETLEIYARLADRLGMGKMKAQLEDLAFPFAYPEEYARVKAILKDYQTFSEPDLADLAEKLREELEILEADITRLDYRVKHLYSLWKKLVYNDYDIAKIHDILALRIIVPTITDCYQALGVVHGLYKPLAGRFKDYIALPKPNGYQSLHTTIFDGIGNIIEIQIRTTTMHTESEYGIYSHVQYKEKTRHATTTSKTQWTQDLLEAQKNLEKPEDFLNHLKLDFFQERVFVYTPQGDVIELLRGAVLLDFAYIIHSDIGNQATGGRINGKMSALDTELKQGDVIEIIHSEKQHPNRKWLDICKTSLARTHIKRYLKEHGGMMDRFLVK